MDQQQKTARKVEYLLENGLKLPNITIKGTIAKQGRCCSNTNYKLFGNTRKQRRKVGSIR